MTKLLVFAAICMSLGGCRTLNTIHSDVLGTEYRTIIQYADSAFEIRKFLHDEADSGWSDFHVYTYDTTVFSVAERVTDNYLEVLNKDKSRLVNLDSLKEMVHKMKDSSLRFGRLPLPIPITGRVTDSSNFAIYISPEIAGMIAAEVVPVGNTCYPRCNPQSYTSVTMFGRGLLTLFFFNQAGKLDSVKSEIIHHD